MMHAEFEFVDEWETPDNQLAKIKTVDQLVVRLLALGYSKKDEVWTKEIVDGETQFCMWESDCPSDGEFSIVTQRSRPHNHNEFYGQDAYSGFLQTIPQPGQVHIHAKLKEDADAIKHDLDSLDIWLAAIFDDDCQIKEWRTYHSWSAGYKNAELVDPEYWSLDEINDLLVSRFMIHRLENREISKEQDNDR